MRLKRLELVGFKSFPEKTVVNFHPNISSIVGPNGCGKSNIIDALKWVMGEQSAIQLRGKSMDDVIFAGSSEKPPVNMAEVSLILANENGNAPEELRHLTEIMITRRIYRSGEREYFLNKQPCRLKDIYNVFLGSGVGARSYSIMHQGNIGAITEASPEERRMFIEEAAGITRYRARKEETLKKLKATENDLLRIKDIMAEVKQRMNSLKRQAKKASRYREYQARKKEIDILASLLRRNEIIAKIDETEAILDSLKDLDNEHASQIGSLDAAIEQVKLEKEAKAREISEQKEQRFDLQRKIDKAEADLTHLRTDMQRLEKEIAEFETEEKTLAAKRAQLETEITQAESGVTQLKRENEELKEKLSTHQESLKTIKENREKIGRRLEEAKASMVRFAAEEARYHNTCQNVAENREALKKRKSEIKNELTVAARNTTRLKNQEAGARADLVETAGLIEKIDSDISGLAATLGQKQQELTEHIRALHSIENERNNMKSRFSAIKKMDENLEWYKDGVRAIMLAAKNNDENQASGNRGILGIAADMVKPEPGYEAAAEAVLGESLQYICVDDHASVPALVEQLRLDKSGRCGFIPVSLFEGSQPSMNDNEDLLINHLEVSPGFETAIDALIGNVVLAKDLENALALWRSSNGSGKRPVVTIEGDLVTANGIIVGGSRDKLSGILAKKQEIKELEASIADLDRQIEKKRGEQALLESVIRELEENLQKSKNDRNQLVARQTELEKNLYRITEELKHSTHHLEILELEQQRLEGEESEMDDEINSYSESLEKTRVAMKETESLIADLTRQFKQASEEFEELNQLLVDLRLQFTVSSNQLENTLKTVERLQSFKNDSGTRLVRIADDIRLKREKSDKTAGTIEKLKSTLKEWYGRLESLDRRIGENENTYEAIAARIEESDRRFAEIRSIRDKNAEKIRYLEMEQVDRRLKCDHIEKRLEERYLTSFDSICDSYLPLLPNLDKSADEMESELAELREKIARLGEVNMGAIDEFNQQKERLEFLTSQHDDLVAAIQDLHKVINKINRVSKERFLETFHSVNKKMAEVFPRLFNGGKGELILTDPSNPLETGVELMVLPPGKKLTRLSLLSGGEKALSAIAFIFSIFLLKPAAFCVMDEIDAPLDEVNIYRFNELLKIIGEKAQIVLVTHNKRTMEFADSLIGVTMEKKGVSKIVSVDLEKETEPQWELEPPELN